MQGAPVPKPGEEIEAGLASTIGVSRGWWIEYPRLFLFAAPPAQSFVHTRAATGEDSFGFNVQKIAQALTAAGPFPQQPGDVILNAQIGGLKVREEAGALTPGATGAIDFIFGLPFGAEIRVPVKVGPIRGSA